MDSQLIAAAAKATLTGDQPFPEIVGMLVEAGVETANMRLARNGSAKRASVDETMARLEVLAPRLTALAEDLGLLMHRAIKSG